MRYGKIIISIFTVFLTAFLAAVVVLTYEKQTEPPEPELSLFFLSQSETGEERIRCWKDPDGAWYVFLPSYAQLDDLLAVPGNDRISIGDVFLSDRMNCGVFSLDEQYPFVLHSGETGFESVITFVRSGKLPTLYIDVQSGSMEYIHMDKTHAETGMLRMYAPDGSLLSTATLNSMKGRGNTTWDAKKKPYNLTLSEPADLLGMGSAQRWILLAEGHNASIVRNKIVYDFSKTVGTPFAPDSEWVDLYLNGEYAGIYLLSERNEIHADRVNIAQEGSALISMESERLLNAQKIPHVLTDAERALRIRNSSMDEEELQRVIQSVESSILAEDGIDPVTGKHWQELIDMDSWVRKYLVEEVFANPDGGAVSQYFYLDGNDASGKLHAGPVWDYDYAMGGEEYWLRDHVHFYTMDCKESQFSNFISWFYPLYHTETFYQYLTEVYEKDFLPQLRILLNERLYEYERYLEPASKVSQIRWSQSDSALHQELEFIRTFLANRTEFLTDLWVRDVKYHTVHVDAGRYYDAHFAVRPGERIPEIPDYVLSDGVGWYRVNTQEPFDITQPIYEDVYIYYKPAETKIPVVTFVPAAFVICVLMVFVYVDRSMGKKNGRPKHESAKTV